MKKISLFIVALLLLFPVVVFALDGKEVDTVTASASGTTVKYSGTTIGGSTAVVCKLYNSNNEEVKRLSSAVSNDTFSGSFEAPAKGTYEVRCANYEGGEIKVATVKVTTNPTSTTTNPNTLDNIKVFVVLFISALILIPGIIVIRKKVNK